MDLSTLLSRARKSLNEPSSGGHWTDAQYTEAANDAQDDFALRTECLETYATFTTDGTNSEYDISEDSLSTFIRISQLRFYTTSTNYYVLPHVSQNEIALRQSETDGTEGTPTAFNYRDRVIEFDLVPEASKTVRVRYTYRPVTLSDDADVSSIPTKYHKALVSYMCWKFAESSDLEVDRTAYFKNEYEQAIAEARKIMYPPAMTYPAIKDDTENLPYA